MTRIFLQSILLISCIYTNAQQAFKNNGNLQIHAGASVTGFGDFTNASSGALVNNGSLYIKQTLTNDQPSMIAGMGALHLNGTSTQSINGAQAFKTFDLITNNTAGFILNNNLSISGAHTFTNGIITTSATPNYLIYESGSSYSGDGDSRHVNGWVKKTGTSDFIFPIGNGTIERTAGIINLSASSEINGRYIQPTTNIWSLQGPLVQVHDEEYWQIDKVSGGTAQIALNWDNGKVAFPNVLVSEIRCAHYNGSVWASAGGTANGNVATTGTITSNAVSTFSPFTFGFESVPLPLSFISFTAERQIDYTVLKWTTANEQNVDHFTIERSDDGMRFYDIARATARNSGNTEAYSSNDYAPLINIAYYRLRSVDTDGKEKLSRIVSVTVNNNTGLTLQTNPVHEKITLIASSALNGIFNYHITAMNGQLAQQGKLVIQNGGLHQLQLNRNLKPGAYTLEISNGPESFRYKLIVQ
jgi:hypothetical protein